jgi:hypothetical protein
MMTYLIKEGLTNNTTNHILMQMLRIKLKERKCLLSAKLQFQKMNHIHTHHLFLRPEILRLFKMKTIVKNRILIRIRMRMISKQLRAVSKASKSIKSDKHT